MQRHRQLVGQEKIFPDLPTDDGVARRNVLMSIPTIPPDLSIDLTASIVSCQSCVVYTTFVGNSVLSFTTSKLNYLNFWPEMQRQQRGMRVPKVYVPSIL